MADRQALSDSLEDYLEAIYQVVQDKGAARPKDVAMRLDVAASSVTNALRALVGRHLINHAPYDIITLTDEGEVLAKSIVSRHDVLTTFFNQVLAVDHAVAEACACKMEHAVPDIVLERLIEYIRFEEKCHGGGTRWLEGTGFVCHAMASEGKLCAGCAESGRCQAMEPASTGA